jgi:hypothetical protein
LYSEELHGSCFSPGVRRVIRSRRVRWMKLITRDAQDNCFKRSIKIHIKSAPTCFGVITIIRERTI